MKWCTVAVTVEVSLCVDPDVGGEKIKEMAKAKMERWMEDGADGWYFIRRAEVVAEVCGDGHIDLGRDS